MGAVYRATDTRLHRTVAVKLVAPGLSANPESRARFEREGRLLASLNHPNVAAIHGMEEFQGVRALVLEFVEGHTLADVIARAHPPAEAESLRSRPRNNESGVAASGGGTPRALSIDDALRIARQIALALTAAHDKGIVHRDLKPANIKITPTGDVKVLDFGIAKLAESHDEFPIETAVTRAAEPTREGTIVGTAAYMSPEQARGQPANKRADIWAYGCVLYEMLAGRRAFDGATWSDTVAKVIEREPDWEALPANLPGAIRTLVRRCLQKNPGDRRQDLADVPFEIADALSSTAPAPSDVRVRPKRWPIAIAGATAAAALAVWAAWTVGRDRASGVPAPGSVEFGVTFPDNYIPSAGIAVSPDGRYIAAGVYSTNDNLWLHTLESSVTRPLAGGEGSEAPFWSPDSRSLGFCGSGGLFKMTLPDGPPTKVGDVCREGTWNRRDEIVVASGGELFKIPASGGVSERLPVPEGRYPVAPQFLPDDRHVIYTDSSRGVGPVVVMSLDGQEHRELVATDAPALFVPPHHLLFVRGTALMAQVFEPERLALEETPVLVAPNVHLGLQQGRRAQVSASANGVLAFGTPLGGSNGQLTWFNRLGQRAASISAPQGSEFLSPALSPDGQISRCTAWIPRPATGTSGRLTWSRAPRRN